MQAEEKVTDGLADSSNRSAPRNPTVGDANPVQNTVEMVSQDDVHGYAGCAETIT